MNADGPHPRRRIGDLCDIINGLAFKPEEWSDSGLPIIRIQNLNGGSEFNFYEGALPEPYLIEAGTLLFAWSGNRGTSFGPFWWNGPRGALNQHIFRVTPKAGVDPHWLFHALHIAKERAEREAHGGSGLVHVRRADLLAYTLPTPAQEEQIPIAKVLDAADAATENIERLLAKLRLVRAGTLQQLLTCGFGRNGELRDPRRHAGEFDQSPIGVIPRAWEVKPLGAVISDGGGVLQTGPFGSQLHAHEYVLDGVPVIMPQDLSDGGVPVDRIARIPEAKARQLARHRLRSGDVVFARRGELDRCAAINATQEGWLCGTGCLLMRAGEAPVDTRWLVATYSTDRSQRQIRARAVGSTMVNLNTRLLADLLIAWPCLSEQREIVKVLDAHDARIHAEEAYRDKLNLLKRGLMDDLLTGRVRVSA